MADHRPETDAFLGVVDQAKQHVHDAGAQAKAEALDHASHGAQHLLQALGHMVRAAFTGKEVPPEADEAVEQGVEHFRQAAGKFAAGAALHSLVTIFENTLVAIHQHGQTDENTVDADDNIPHLLPPSEGE